MQIDEMVRGEVRINGDVFYSLYTNPTGFVDNAEYSATSLVNTIFDWMVNTANFSPSDLEGGNGLNFVSARDPRVVVARDAAGNPVTRLGQDGSTRAVTIQG